MVRLTQAMNNPTLFKANGEPVMNSYERCNEVWKDIAKSRNLDWQSITAAPSQDPAYFEASPVTLTLAKEQDNDPSSLH